ncbi:MAG: hypothetical protein A2170_08495 [Deltaproteobacteria bacterium RBG_13_53_10]|nr:MAG: hypothetical protein A2170_08495 [Deltaproteobacteria bacterium RBG_13_53_10]
MSGDERREGRFRRKVRFAVSPHERHLRWAELTKAGLDKHGGGLPFIEQGDVEAFIELFHQELTPPEVELQGAGVLNRLAGRDFQPESSRVPKRKLQVARKEGGWNSPYVIAPGRK